MVDGKRKREGMSLSRQFRKSEAVDSCIHFIIHNI